MCSSDLLTLSIEPTIGNAEKAGGHTASCNIAASYAGPGSLQLLSSRMLIDQKCPQSLNSLQWSGSLNLASQNRFVLTFHADTTGVYDFTLILNSTLGNASKSLHINI